MTAVIKESGSNEILVFPMAFRNDQFDYEVVVHGDDFAAEGPIEAVQHLESVLKARFQANLLAVLGPGRDRVGKLLKRTVTWSDKGF